MSHNFKTETDLFFSNIYEKCFYLLSEKPSSEEWLYWANQFKAAAEVEADRKDFLLKVATEFESEAKKAAG